MKHFKTFIKYLSILIFSLLLLLYFDPNNNLYYKYFNSDKIISELKSEDGSKITLTSDGFVTIEDKNGIKDMLPITLISEELAQKFMDDVKLKENND